MPSEARIRASRANGARSRGPVTPEGKARSSRNAMRHGLLAKITLLGDESAASFDALIDILAAEFEPVNELEFGMIEEMANSYWRIRRAWNIETELFESSMQHQPGANQRART